MACVYSDLGWALSLVEFRRVDTLHDGQFGQPLMTIQFMEMVLKLRMKDFRSGVRELSQGSREGRPHPAHGRYRRNSWWLPVE